jgi:hypothetical protein
MVGFQIADPEGLEGRVIWKPGTIDVAILYNISRHVRCSPLLKRCLDRPALYAAGATAILSKNPSL